MKKLYKHCKADLEELSDVLSGSDSGHDVAVDISAECTGIMINKKTGKRYCVRTVCINGKETHFTETLYQFLLAHGVIIRQEG